MRKWLVLAAALFVAGLACFESPAAYWQSRDQVAIATASPAYVFRGSGTSLAGTSDATFSIDIGTASADRLVIVASTVSAATTITSVVANGVTLTQDVTIVNNYRVGIHSGLVTAGSGPQNVVITWASASFQEKNAFVYTATGLASNVVKQTTSGLGSGSINVTAGDFLFAAARDVAGFPTFAGSTETPDGTRQVGLDSTSADWTVDATNAAFSVNAGGGSDQMVAASYR